MAQERFAGAGAFEREGAMGSMLTFRKAMLVLSCAAVFVAVPGISMLQGLLALPIIADLRWDLPSFMLSVGISAFAMIFAQEPARRLCSKVPVGGFLLGALVFTALFRSARFFVSTLTGWYITAVLSGFCCGLVVYVPVPMIASQWFPSRMGTMTAAIMLGSPLGTALLSPLAQLCIDLAGWRVACLAMGVATLAPVPLVALFVRNSPAPSVGLMSAPSADLRSSPPEVRSGGGCLPKETCRLLACLLIVVFSVSLADNMPAQAPAVAASFGFDSSVAAVGLTILAGAGAMGKIVFGLGSDRYGADRCTIVCCTVTLLGFLALLFAPYSAAILYGGWAAVGFGCAPLPLLPGLLAHRFFARDALRISSRLSAGAAAANAIGPVALSLGPAWTGSYAPVFIALASVFAFNIVVLAAVTVKGNRPAR